jgi:hypothetical protein
MSNDSKTRLVEERWRLGAYAFFLLWNFAGMIGPDIDWMPPCGVVCYATHFIIKEIEKKK